MSASTIIFIIPIVSWGSRLCGTTHGSVYVNISNYLQWIQYIQLLDAVHDYRQNGELPYEKLNNGLFHALFQTLADTII